MRRRQAGTAASRPTTILPSSVPFDEGSGRHGVATDNGRRRELAAFGWPRLDRVRLHTLSRRQRALVVNIPCGSPKRRVWRKLHLGIDEKTLEVWAVETTGSHIGDAPVLPDLLVQIPADQEIGGVTADGAYDTREYHETIADRGVHAVIPPRKNAKPRKTVTARAVSRQRCTV